MGIQGSGYLTHGKKSTSRNIWFWFETSENDHSGGTWGSKCPCPQVNQLFCFHKNALSFPELPFYFPELPFYFPEVSFRFIELHFCFLEVSFYFPEVLFYFPKMPFYFLELPFYFPELPFYLSKMAYWFPEPTFSFPEVPYFYLLCSVWNNSQQSTFAGQKYKLSRYFSLGFGKKVNTKLCFYLN